MQSSTFYLGRFIDDEEPVRYDPADLTTHAVLIGMTGSGKTGLMIAMLEEAARQGVPAIIIDPKGDLTNLLLHFPNLAPADFAPWIDPEQARRQSTTLDALAEETAARWRKGLGEWNLGEAELTALRSGVDYTIYTPGSSAGVPVNLLASFEAPPDWQSSKEAARERIASTVTAVLGLVGMNNIDPLRSREHILLSNIFEMAWSQGRSLDLATLIEQVQVPPFERLGAFPIERFFPEKDRFDLALLLNNFLAAPSFQAWLEGQPLDAGQLLFGQGKRPRFSIFTLAHLGENERMFFVTLLLAAVEGWMRSQRGSSGLRALLAFDEIVGYLPPVQNPPSRAVLLRLLKQARAFGLGLILATQNPTDLNYKALSNAGTWLIGRLQTEQDKDRLLDGLQSLDTGIDRGDFDRMIARLGQRLFLLHNVHNPPARIFRTRWPLNYLAGPLTRAQIPALKPYMTLPAPTRSTTAAPVSPDGQPNPVARQSPVGQTPTVSQPPPVEKPPFAFDVPASPRPPISASSSASPVPVSPRPPVSASSSASPERYSSTRPAIPTGAAEVFFPRMQDINRALTTLGGAFRGPLEPQGIVYRPGLLVQATVRYLDRRYGFDYIRRLACLVPGRSSAPNWDSAVRPPIDPAYLKSEPQPDARFYPLPVTLSTARGLSSLQKDFLEWLYRSGTIYLRTNDGLRVSAGPDTSDIDFRRQLDLAMRQGLQAAQEKAAATYDTRLEAVQRKIERQQVTVDRREDEVGQRKSEQTSTDLEFVASLFSKRKKSISRSATKRRMTQQAKGDLDEARHLLESLQEEWRSVDADKQAALARLQAEWQDRAAQISNVPVSPSKSNLFVDQFAIAWLPYYLVKNPDGMIEAPGF